MNPLTQILNEKQNAFFGFDAETDNDNNVICYSIAWGPTYAESACVFVDETYEVEPLLDSAKLIMHYGVKADVPPMWKIGQRVRVRYDTYVAARLHFFNLHDGFGLKELCEINLSIPPWGDVPSLLREYKTMRNVPREILEEYNRWDAINTWRLMLEFFKPHFSGRRLFLLQIESALMHVLADMRNVGIGFDKAAIAEVKETVLQQQADLQQQISDLNNGNPVPITSPGAMQSWLINTLKVDTSNWPKTPKTGRLQMKMEIYREYETRYPILGLIAEWKELEKLRNTYIDSYAGCVAPDGRIHSNYDAFGNGTGRFSSSSPNMQNVIKTTRGLVVRKAFVARPGYFLVASDYRQIQLIIMVAMSGDKTAMEIFADPTRDLHREVYTWCLEIPISAVTKDQRQAAKAVNFGKAFNPGGSGAFAALIPNFDGSNGEHWNLTRVYERRWYDHLKGVEQWHKHHIFNTISTPYNTTWWKRHRPLYTLPESASWKEKTRRACMSANGDVQGTEGDIAKIGMVLAWNEIQKLNSELPLPTYLIGNVHDDTMFECPIQYAHIIVPRLEKALTSIPDFPIPIRVETRVGTNWYDMHDFDSSIKYAEIAS